MRFSTPRSVGKIVVPAGQRRRQAFHIRDGVLELVRVLVALRRSPTPSWTRGGVAQMHRHRLGDGVLARPPCTASRAWYAASDLGATAQINGDLRQRQVAFAEFPGSGPPAARRWPAPARADRPGRYLRSPCAPGGARCTGGPRRPRACGPASRARRPHRSTARTCAAPKSG